MTYADSSFVVSIYRTSEGISERARRQIKQSPGPVFLSPLSLLEIRNAFNMAIGRGEIGEAEREAVIADIERQIEAGFFRMADVSQTDIYAKARELSDRHTPAMLTRSLDLMHVAVALLCKSRVFLSTDTRQRAAAQAEGLEVKP
ncbi:MAG: type II toxin-antitoxin system VapC family toxin [Terrimicrobiaceae bacterium]